MTRITKMYTKIKKRFIILLIIVSGIFSTAYVDSYFELSKNLDIFATLYKELNIHYVDETEPGKLMKTAIDAMLSSLDPYTVYYPESDIEDYRFMTTGEYGGIGTMIRKKEEFIQITEPYEGAPAQKAGLMAGDIIIKIDDKSIEGKSTTDVSKILKGQAGTEVQLDVKRGDEPAFKVTLTREEIKVKDVPYFGEVKDGIGYIKLNSFTSSASKELIGAFKEMKEGGWLNGLIIDLRGNGGGLLMESVNIVNAFVNKGEEVVLTKGKLQEWHRSHKALNNPVDLEIPLAVIIDGGSASASEIVSGALQDLDRAVIIGERSFGKGLVQQTKPLSYNSTLKVTVAKYYIPSGRCIQRLDYSTRDEDGKVKAVPDSLMKFFETRAGRKVKDGAGIYPDLEIESKSLSKITSSLLSKDLIFDFVTLYRAKYDSIAPPRLFKLSDEDYNWFKVFLSDKDYDYTTKSEKLLADWESVAKKERQFDVLEEEYAELKKKLKHNKEQDLITFKDEIVELIENEIVSRYYYQSGRLAHNLSKDENIEKALEVLINKEEYATILGKITANNDKQ